MINLLSASYSRFLTHASDRSTSFRRRASCHTNHDWLFGYQATSGSWPVESLLRSSPFQLAVYAKSWWGLKSSVSPMHLKDPLCRCLRGRQNSFETTSLRFNIQTLAELHLHSKDLCVLSLRLCRTSPHGLTISPRLTEWPAHPSLQHRQSVCPLKCICCVGLQLQMLPG